MVTHAHALQEADETLATFEAAYPEAVLASANLYGEVPPASEPASTVDTATSPVETGTPTQAVLSEPLPVTESPTIPDGQPQQSHPKSLSFVDTPSPQVGEEKTDSPGSVTKAGSLKTRLRSRQKHSKQPGLARSVRQRTAPALPGVRKKKSSKHQPLPESPSTPLVTDSGYLVTDAPRGTPPTRPKRPDAGAAELYHRLLLLFAIRRIIIEALKGSKNMNSVFTLNKVSLFPVYHLWTFSRSLFSLLLISVEVNPSHEILVSMAN